MHFGRERSLIVGADGFLGRNLSRWFDVHDHRWFGVGRTVGDLAEPGVAEAAFAAVPEVDRIFHVVTRQRTGPVQIGIQGELLRINSLIHLNVVEAWRKHQPQAKFISMGSSCTYPESNAPLSEDRFGEGGAHPSVYGYAHGKLTIATASRAYGQQYGLRWLHCVLATMFGPMDNKAEDRSHFMGAMIDRAWRERSAGARAFTVWGSPETVRELLYVDDQIEAILAAAAVFDDRILNCAANAPVTVGEAADAVLNGMDWAAPVESPPGSFQGAGYKVLASDVFLAATGWRPKTSLVAGVHRVLEEEYIC
jgi:GDP-L-fucose synthase